MANLICTQDMTQDAVISMAHNATAVPALIALYILFAIILILAGWAFKSSNTSWGRFFWIWATTMIITGLFLLFFIFSPNSIQWLVTQWSNM